MMKSIRIPLLAAILMVASAGAYAHPADARAAPDGAGRQGPRVEGAAPLRPHHAPHGARVFARLDANRDGVVSAAEVRAANQRRTRMFLRADANRDGQVTREEMVALRATMRAHRPDQAREGHRQWQGRQGRQERLHQHRPGAAPAAPASEASPGVEYRG
jgi:hypothetical protein